MIENDILDFSRKEGIGMEAMGNREKQFIISGSGLILFLIFGYDVY